jgi:Recombinational DNA repair protein (RecF pathway)
LATQPEGEAPLRRFELALLEETGYALPLDGDFAADGRYAFDPETGARPAAVHDREPVSGATLLALREQRVDDDAQRLELRRVLRSAIDRRLGGRPLRSREWLRALRR